VLRLSNPADYPIAITPELWHNDDGPGKSEAIFQIIGRKPVLVFGNSDGDLPMLQYTSTNTRPTLCLILHHTDQEQVAHFGGDAGKLYQPVYFATERAADRFLVAGRRTHAAGPRLFPPCGRVAEKVRPRARAH
jgi:hypothetical protein